MKTKDQIIQKCGNANCNCEVCTCETCTCGKTATKDCGCGCKG